MTSTTGLTDRQMMLMALIFGVFFAVQSYIVGLPEEERPPTYVFTILGIVGAAILPIKNILGVRDATTSRISKETSTDLDQFRKIPEQKPAPPK